MIAAGEFGHDRTLPADAAGGVETKRLVGRQLQPPQARGHLAGQRAAGRRHERARRLRAGGGVRQEAEAVHAAHRMAFHQHVAGGGDRAHQLVAALQTAGQHRVAAVDEALGQRLVKRIRQAVLDGAVRSCIAWNLEPVAAGGNVGPGADMGDALHQRIDVALGAIDAGDLVGDPGRRQHAALTSQVAEYLRSRRVWPSLRVLRKSGI
jgi:hypothetical protein